MTTAWKSSARLEFNGSSAQEELPSTQLVTFLSCTPWERARRPKICKLVEKRELAHIVALNLKKLWSPEQIAGWLKRTYPDHKDFQVSDETIYRSLFIQAPGRLKERAVAAS